MESMNPGGTGKDRAARSMILDAESRGELPPPLKQGSIRCVLVANGQENDANIISRQIEVNDNNIMMASSPTSSSNNNDNSSNIPDNIHNAIITALRTTKTNGILIEGTSGSTGISLASLSCSRGHGVIVVMPDDQSSQKVEYLQRLGAGVVVVQNCSISNPQHYVNVARRIWEWLQVERLYDDYYWDNFVNNACSGDEKRSQRSVMEVQPAASKRLLQAAFMNQFENLANVKSHYTTTGPEIYNQLNGNVDAFVMSAGTGGTLVGVGAYLKEQVSMKQSQNVKHKGKQTQSKQPPRIVLADPPGSSLYNKIKYGVAYTSQQSEQRLRRHRYDTLAEGIGLDRITANFGLGCEEDYDSAFSFGERVDMLMNDNISSDTTPVATHTSLQPTTPYKHSKIIDDALSITDQQAIYMAHYLLRHEGLFVGSSTAMNIVAALTVAIQMSTECEHDNDDCDRDVNIVTVVCDGGHRHTSRFWNKKFVVEDWGLVWPGDIDDSNDVNNHDCVNQSDDGRNILELLGIDCSNKSIK